MCYSNSIVLVLTRPFAVVLLVLPFIASLDPSVCVYVLPRNPLLKVFVVCRCSYPETRHNREVNPCVQNTSSHLLQFYSSHLLKSKENTHIQAKRFTLQCPPHHHHHHLLALLQHLVFSLFRSLKSIVFVCETQQWTYFIQVCDFDFIRKRTHLLLLNPRQLRTWLKMVSLANFELRLMFHAKSPSLSPHSSSTHCQLTASERFNLCVQPVRSAQLAE